MVKQTISYSELIHPRANNKTIKCIQINIGHDKAGQSALQQYIITHQVDITLISEPYVNLAGTIAMIGEVIPSKRTLDGRIMAAIVISAQAKDLPIIRSKGQFCPVTEQHEAFSAIIIDSLIRPIILVSIYLSL